jgi:phosphoribosylformylglycinamidine synthase
VTAGDIRAAAQRALANEVIHEVLVDTVPDRLPGPGGTADLEPREVPIVGLEPPALLDLSRRGGLALNGAEMAAIAAHFRKLDREPRVMELETIAQTWSEHCKHKTLTSRIRFENQVIENLLKATIFHVTETLDREFCVSVFKDNAGVIRFDDEDCVCIKVETHNHPSAIEPYGGAGTGVGGVIRDVLGTGLGARPVASSDVFCFAPIDLPATSLPKGCLPPLQLLRGVVAGVRDYGNPMGIPTVNGAIHFDPAFVGNPLVYVGNVGILPRHKVSKQARPGDVILSIGGRTGRDGIHGATFSSLELHTESETVSSGAVQIGDPITERKVMDAVIRARDEDLFDSITDCGAGGFSSAVGEMADGLGADVELSSVPLKYQGLAPWEIWISEAQERMVLSVPEESLGRVLQICAEEDVEATAMGRFTDSGRLVVRYQGREHMDLDLEFLHRGLPAVEREAVYVPPDVRDPELSGEPDLGQALLAILSDLNVASKEWVIRQYDHEVQAGSAGKPLVGVCADGPADAAVLAPKLGSRRGIVLGNGLNPRYSHIDVAAMAECALDEAMRNIVAVGGDPEHTAVLDNYCWGNTDSPEKLGELVRASLALRDLALVYNTPFVSGKDSLNNEFRDGATTIAIPGCILVTALSVIPDVGRTVCSALQRVGSLLVLVGVTNLELGGSVYWKTRGALGATVPRVDATRGKAILDGVYRAIQARAVLSAHDLSEGGLGAAAAEMAIGGRLGLRLDLDTVPAPGTLRADEILFSESQSRFLLEVDPQRRSDLAANLHEVPFAFVGEVLEEQEFTCVRGPQQIFRLPLEDIVRAWKQPLDLDGTLVGDSAAQGSRP